MAPHSRTLAWKIPWMEKPGRLQFMGHLESDTTERLHFHFSLSRVGEGNGNPLQCSCLENRRDGGAWWAAIYGFTQSRTRLKRLSSSSSPQVTATKSLSIGILKIQFHAINNQNGRWTNSALQTFTHLDSYQLRTGLTPTYFGINLLQQPGVV